MLDALCGGVPPPRHASLRAIGPAGAPLIDRGLVLWFEGPASFTGEDMAELHVHGGRAVIGAVIEAVLTLPGTRLAEPGAVLPLAVAEDVPAARGAAGSGFQGFLDQTCWSEEWLGTRSTMMRMLRSCAAESIASKSPRVPNSGSMSQ